VESAVERLQKRLGPQATEDALHRGSRLTYPATGAHARQAIRTSASPS
jgi:hypothetical protein